MRVALDRLPAIRRFDPLALHEPAVVAFEAEERDAEVIGASEAIEALNDLSPRYGLVVILPPKIDPHGLPAAFAQDRIRWPLRPLLNRAAPRRKL
jgi:hypothetical protein